MRLILPHLRQQSSNIKRQLYIRKTYQLITHKILSDSMCKLGHVEYPDARHSSASSNFRFDVAFPESFMTECKRYVCLAESCCERRYIEAPVSGTTTYAK
jgi:hypothetical protein